MLDEIDLTWTIIGGVFVITTPEEAENRLITRVYDVSDLVFPMNDKPYDGRELPTTGKKKSQATSDFCGMGQGPRSIPGAGEGMFNVADDPGVSAIEPLAQLGASAGGGFGGMGGMCMSHIHPRFSAADGTDMDTMAQLIIDTIEPRSWLENGGPGSLNGMGQLLVILQTLDVHMQIDDLLETLRAARRGVPTVVVDARWMLLESESLDPVTLEQLKHAAPGARGRIACMSGQLVHLTAGERRLVAIGAIPVVGSGIGYQPVVAIPNVGIVLEVRPTVGPDRQTAVLDVRNIVTQWREPGPPIQVGGHSPPSEMAEGEIQTIHQPASGASASVDRVRMPTQQFAATMRVPLGQPVLIGGMTLSPTEDTEEESKKMELYLVIETSIVGQENAPGEPGR
ncbi:MAG: hypothetical protein V3R99_12025 [Thermoguttaceae bacterium]